MKSVVLISALLITGCTRCGTPGSAQRPHQKRQTDLRSTLTVIFPEYRGAQVKRGEAKLTRTVAEPAEVAEALFIKTLEANQFARAGASWVRAPYEARSEGTTWVIAVPLDASTVERLYMAPTAMSTADLTMWYPRDATASRTEREVFELRLEYLAATETRAVFLTRQLVRLLLGNGQWLATTLPNDWELDGGPSDTRFDARLEERSTRAVLELHREGAAVALHYTLVTDEP